MKIEYLDGDRPPPPLVRLFEFAPDEVRTLQQVCNDLADGQLMEFPLHAQQWVRPVDGCQLIWRASKTDIGIRFSRPGRPLVLEYSDEAWREVSAKLAPFVSPVPCSFNWLSIEGDIQLLISMDGRW